MFISGHFNNFELMAMIIEREGVELSAVYRPLNNKFLNMTKVVNSAGCLTQRIMLPLVILMKKELH